MNDDQLNTLLSDQQSLEDNGFTVNVMNSLPKRPNHKLRAFILLTSTTLGSICALYFMGGASKTFLREVFNGLVNYQGSGLAMICGVVLFYATIFVSTSEEIS